MKEKFYRFKTKKEFEKQYGAGWKWIVGWNSLTEMDYLLDKEITQEEYDEIQKTRLVEINGWLINRDMVTVDYREIIADARTKEGKIIRQTKPQKQVKQPQTKNMQVAISVKTLGKHTVATILYNGKSYIGESKCHPDDTFDKDIGVALAIRRASEKITEYTVTHYCNKLADIDEM